MKFILGKKIGMTQIFSKDGKVIPVTKIQAGPCQITQVKKIKKDGKEVFSLEVGFGKKKQWRLSKPQAGHLKDLEPSELLKSFTTLETTAQRGDLITLDTFEIGDKVTIIGTSKGKGFAGVVKRHHFAGGPASHGHKDNLRMPGSIGAGGVQRVFKGMRMAGRMGGEQITVKNLEIIELHPETNTVYIKGAVPGGANGFLIISCTGELKLSKKNEKMISETAQEKSAPQTEVSNELDKQNEPIKNEVSPEISKEDSDTKVA